MERKEFIKSLGIAALAMGVAPTLMAFKGKRKNDFETCKLVWENLCGNGNIVYENDAFNYVHPVKRRPNVLIYGDSVSIKYTPAVRVTLQEKATVFRLFKNGGSSKNFIPNMEKMEQSMYYPNLEGGWDFNWDIIHFNVGLHDLKYLKGRKLSKDGKQVSTTDEYKTNLNVICKYLKTKFPKAKLIFATTTAVPVNAKGRFNGDSVKYNQAAKEVLVNYPDIIINDLYAFTLPHAQEWAQEPGNVHYNEIGFTQQGKEVARIITKYL